MNRNIEIKAKARNFNRQQLLAESISDRQLEILSQTDTFFHVSSGRLKLRVFDENYGELIFYRRIDMTEAKTSEYHISPTAQPATFRQKLVSALGIIGEIKKTRRLYRFGQTRIHFDEVENLGQFIELEYVLKSNEPIENGEISIAELMKKLEITDDNLIGTAYLDLLKVEENRKKSENSKSE